MERTLSIIKPDAVAKNVIGEIYSRFEAAGFKIVGAKMLHFYEADAGIRDGRVTGVQTCALPICGRW